MKTFTRPSELIEKERIRLQINAQVEEFLRRGGAIEVVSVSAKPAAAIVGSAWDDDGEFTSYAD